MSNNNNDNKNNENGSIRRRASYIEMRKDIEDALDCYWSEAGQTVVSHHNLLKVCDKVMLTSFRLLKYLRNEFPNFPRYSLVTFANEDKIKDLNDAACNYYCLPKDKITYFFEEAETLEILSRSAFNEIKTLKSIDEGKNF